MALGWECLEELGATTSLLEKCLRLHTPRFRDEDPLEAMAIPTLWARRALKQTEGLNSMLTNFIKKAS